MTTSPAATSTTNARSAGTGTPTACSSSKPASTPRKARSSWPPSTAVRTAQPPAELELEPGVRYRRRVTLRKNRSSGITLLRETIPRDRFLPETVPRDRANADLATDDDNLATDDDNLAATTLAADTLAATTLATDDDTAASGPATVPHADALVGLARAFLDPHANADRDPQVRVIVHLDADVLTDEAHAGIAAYQDGRPISATTARRLTCDCELIAMLHADGDVLDASQPTRRIPRALRRALTARDHGCTYPSCTETRDTHLHAHHIRHWADGGETRISNLTLLRLSHECCR